MADMIHMSLSNFRNTMLTAVACLECELRDRTIPQGGCPVPQFPDDGRLLGLESSMDLLRRTIMEFNHTLVEMGLRIQDVEHKVDLLSITPNPCGKNPICTNQEFTSYRYETNEMEGNITAVSSIEDVGETLHEDIMEVDEAVPAGTEVEPEVDESVPVEAEAEPEIDEQVAVPCSESVHSIAEAEEGTEENEMTVLQVDGVDYYLDNENNVFTLDEEAGEYTHVGTYDPEDGSIAFLEQAEEEEVEEQEEVVDEDPMEEFTYKGETYYRDSESNVYTLDEEAGEYTHIGTWNGKKIVKV